MWVWSQEGGMNLWSFVRWNNISIHITTLFYIDWFYCHLVRSVVPITVSLTHTPSTSDMNSLTGVRKILYDLFVPITIRPQILLAMAEPAWNSMTFHDLLWPSMTFYHLLRPLWPSMIKCLLSRPGLIAGRQAQVQSQIQVPNPGPKSKSQIQVPNPKSRGPLWPSMIKCLLSRPGLIAGPLHSTPLPNNSQLIPRLDPIDSKSSSF